MHLILVPLRDHHTALGRTAWTLHCLLTTLQTDRSSVAVHGRKDWVQTLFPYIPSEYHFEHLTLKALMTETSFHRAHNTLLAVAQQADIVEEAVLHHKYHTPRMSMTLVVPFVGSLMPRNMLTPCVRAIVQKVWVVRGDSTFHRHVGSLWTNSLDVRNGLNAVTTRVATIHAQTGEVLPIITSDIPHRVMRSAN